jgi:hypothetical protein
VPTTTTPRIQVILKKPRPVPGLISVAQAIDAALAAHAVTFPSPTPTLAVFKSDVDALVLAQAAARTRAKGAVQTRDAKLAVVVTDLNQLRAYVESVADGDPSNATAIANSACMEVRKARITVAKNAVNAKKGIVLGTVVVSARVGTKQKQSHEWEYSTDAGKTWVALIPTTQAKTTITGLTPGVTVLVRHRAITGTGPTVWTDAASLMLS